MNAPIEKEASIALVTKLQVISQDVGKYLDWLARLMMQGVETSGVLSAETIPPVSSGGNEWVLVLRFRSQPQIDAWLQSDAHRRLFDELSPYLQNKEVAISEAADLTYASRGGISVAVVTQVKEGYEKAYCAFESRYQSAQARSPGYYGAYVQPPLNGAAGTWVTVIRFDSQKAMEQWFESNERKSLLAESDKIVSSMNFQNVTTSFPGWFRSEAKSGEGPPNWKTALLILLGLYPSVMVVILYFLPLVQAYPAALDNFIGNILTVAFTTWVTMPFFIYVYKSWLFPKENTPWWVSPVSIFSLLFFFAIEVAFFWRYF